MITFSFVLNKSRQYVTHSNWNELFFNQNIRMNPFRWNIKEKSELRWRLEWTFSNMVWFLFFISLINCKYRELFLSWMFSLYFLFLCIPLISTLNGLVFHFGTSVSSSFCHSEKGKNSIRFVLLFGKAFIVLLALSVRVILDHFEMLTVLHLYLFGFSFYHDLYWIYSEGLCLWKDFVSTGTKYSFLTRQIEFLLRK